MRRQIGFNWATRSRAWKARALILGELKELGFNWATRSRAWKEGIYDGRICRICMLQLGHALSRVESERRKANRRITKCRFNWATRSRAWKVRALKTWTKSREELQLGHALSRVERLSGAGPFVVREWLQLGHALSRVERVERLALADYRRLASIGPRALARGKRPANRVRAFP